MSNPNNPASAPAGASNADAPHRPPDDKEEVYYQGSPLMRGSLRQGFLWLISGVVLIALAIAAPIFGFAHYTPWWVWAVLPLVGIILILIPMIESKTIRYRVSNYRIDYERGLLGRDINTLELWHVEDICYHQTLFDRILDVGTIEVISRDEKMPKLVLRDIPHSRQLFQQLEQRIIAVKRSRGVLKVDPG